MKATGSPSTSTSPAAFTSPGPWWNEGGGSASPAGASSGNESSIPGPGWPSQATLEYLTKIIMLVILLLALPFLLEKLLTAPHELGAHSAGFATGIASMG